MVNAMAPKAPTGASFMIMLMMPKITWEKLSIILKTNFPFSPI